MVMVEKGVVVVVVVCAILWVIFCGDLFLSVVGSWFCGMIYTGDVEMAGWLRKFEFSVGNAMHLLLDVYTEVVDGCI